MNKIQRTLIETIFKSVEVKGFIQTSFRYMIDSKYRKRQRISQYLEEQVKNASPSTYKIALELRGQDEEKGIINILKWVKKNFTYKTDNQNYGRVEKWNDIESMMSGKYEDCDGLNTIIYVLARLQGIGSEILYAAIGEVSLGNKSGGHFWLLFWSTNDDKLVSIDATYYVNTTRVKYRPAFKLTSERYQKLWYIFNEGVTLKIK